jgi:hypothetical protein
MNTIVRLMICVSVSLPAMAGYDLIIEDGYTSGLTLHNSESLLVSGGGVGIVNMYDLSSATITDSSPLAQFSGGVWWIRQFDQTDIRISGGEVAELDLNSNATAMISGGSIIEIFSYQSAWKNEGQPPVLVPNPHITMICRPDWTYNLQSKMLKGSWLDGSTFNIQLVDIAGYSPVIENIQFVPEPITLLLLAAGGAIIRRR